MAPPPQVATQQPGLPAPAVAGTPPPVPGARASAPQSTRDPAAILADKAASAPPKIVSTVPAAGLGGSTNDPFNYYVQAGAYGRTEDAEQQRAKLAMMGMEGKLTEREQNGRTVYRVRIGPFDRKLDADAAKDRLVAGGVEATLVRVQR